MKVIFLDFDNVLNGEGTTDWIGPHECTPIYGVVGGHVGIDRSRIALLNQIIARTGAKVVFSTSWRKPYRTDQLRKFLEDRGFVGQYVDPSDMMLDQTPSKMSLYGRGAEIRMWFDYHRDCMKDKTTEPVESFVVLDDMPTPYCEDGRDRQVRCRLNEGLTPEGVETAVRILERPVTRVVNLRKEPYDVYVGRAGKGQDGFWGNPFPLEKGADRWDLLRKFEGESFKERLYEEKGFKERLEELRGKRLGCFCAPKICHAEVYVEYLEGMPYQYE